MRIQACGPFFPATVLRQPDETLRAVPVATFALELQRLGVTAPPGLSVVPPPEGTNVYEQSVAVDLADLRAALAAAGMRSSRIDRRLAEYRAVRATLQERACPGECSTGFGRPAPLPPVARPTPPSVPEGLPAEFAGYLEGLISYRFDRTNEARSAWLSLLALPASERRQRTVWAAYMLGRSWSDADPAQAVAWFRKTRQFHEEGFPDTLGLTAASLGWEGRAEWRRRDLARAIELYLQQLATGDASAIASLHIVATNVVASGPRELARLAAQDPARRVVTACFLSRESGWNDARPWLAAIESAGVHDVAGTDRLAWLAYQAGDAARADRWLRAARPESPAGQWVRAKLLLRAGKLDEAAAVLAGLVRAFPRDTDWDGAYKPEDVVSPYDSERYPACQAAGELAVLKMGRGQYIDALDLLARHHRWQDAAYVAERVLTSAELHGYVDRNWSSDTWNSTRAWGNFAELGTNSELATAETGGLLRWLLARRLTRARCFADARACFPPGLRLDFDTYTNGLARGRAAGVPAPARAAALFAAARVADAKGMELLGTECEPDWHYVEGNYELAPTAKDRLSGAGTRPYVTADEQRRVRAQPAAPDKRFHYRYVAADLAWEAVQLMPDQTDGTARALYEAGGWLKRRDPNAANRFYRALIARCGQTDLGRRAAEKRWFPEQDGGEIPPNPLARH